MSKFNNPVRPFILQNAKKQVVPCINTAKEVSFEWSRDRIRLTDPPYCYKTEDLR